MTASITLLTGLLILGACTTANPGTTTAAPATTATAPGTTPASAASSPTVTSTARPSPTRSTALKKAKSVYWEGLKPGMCVLFPAKEDAFNVTVTDCRAEHDVEVTLRGRLKGGNSYPGDDNVDTAAEPICEKALESYVKRAYNDSSLDWDYVSPSKEAWEDGSRRLICFVYDPENEKPTTSFKNSEL